MISLQTIKSYTPAHVFLIQGKGEVLDELVHELKETGTSHSYFSFPSLTIETAKELRTVIGGCGVSEHWMLISFSFFTKDASDIFLKLLEEPHSGMHIVLCTPYPYLVPDTIRSRVLFLSAENLSDVQSSFFTLSLDQKLEYVKKNFGSDSDDDAGIRKVEAFALLDEYEKVLHEHKRFSESALLYDAKYMIARAGIPPKQALEYLIALLG